MAEKNSSEIEMKEEEHPKDSLDQDRKSDAKEKPQQDDEETVSSDSAESDESDDSEEEENDFLSGLSEEQKRVIQERQAALQAKYKSFDKQQKEAKVKDVLESSMVPDEVTAEEAEMAIECCNNDELEAMQRLATEPDFLETVRDFLEEKKWMKKRGGRVAFKTRDNGEKVQISIDLNGKRMVRQSSSSSSRSSSNKPPSGFKMDGERRVKSLRLGDALAQLERIKRTKEVSVEPIAEEATPSEKVEEEQEGKMEAANEVANPKVTFAVDDAVGAFSNKTKKFEAATITKVNKKAYEVKFGDGTVQKGVKPEKIRPAEQEQPNAARTKNKEQSESKKEDATKKTETKSVDKKQSADYTEEELLGLGWSTARVKAFLNRKENPNAYYYRFNDLDEEQETGEWSDTNKQIFLELIKDGVNYRWGELSMKIPGRVGYQCSNYYRKLIMAGQIVDPNYEMVDGKLKFTRPKGLGRGGGKSQSIEQKPANPRVEKLRKKRLAEEPKRKKGAKKKPRRGEYVYAHDIDSELEDSDDGEGYGYGGYGARGNTRTKKSNTKDGKRVTPKPELLPGLRCPMTFEPIYDPAISPYGHVMSYDTWLRVLGRKPKNTCPFTKQPLTRRSLVKLTVENVEDFKSKIVDINTSIDQNAISASN